MRKFVSGKKNPNPPWPSEQPVVMVPPGVSPAAVGVKSEKLYNMKNSNQNAANTTSEKIPVKERTDDNRIMDFSQSDEYSSGNLPIPEAPSVITPSISRTSHQGMTTYTGGGEIRCNDGYINGYLCSQIGNTVKVEFLFGEQTHVEKTGILEDVGKNYIVIRENGFGNRLVASIDNIKFINISMN